MRWYDQKGVHFSIQGLRMHIGEVLHSADAMICKTQRVGIHQLIGEDSIVVACLHVDPKEREG